MSIARVVHAIAHAIFRMFYIRKQRAATGRLLRLDDERLADIGLTRDDIHLAMNSDDPVAVARAARDRNAGENLARHGEGRLEPGSPLHEQFSSKEAPR